MTIMKPGLIALMALLLTLATFAADVMLLQFPIVRNGYWTYVPLAATLTLAVFAVAKRRSWTTIVPSALIILLVGLYTATRLIATPNSPPTVTLTQTFPDWSLPDHEGHTVRIHDEAEKGPLVIVLFRGSW
jgi:hypothetical protein